MPPLAAFSFHRAPRTRLWLRKGFSGQEDPAEWLENGSRLLRERAGPSLGAGRGLVRRVQLGGRLGVWRQNLHGGLLGGLTGPCFLGLTRLEDELLLSETLLAHGISTPEILLAYAERTGICWHQHLVTAEVPGSATVFARAGDPRAQSASRELLERLFTIGLWAPDLHPANLLWQEAEQRCWIIDLADARLLGRPLTPRERASRRARYERYFRKHGAPA